MRLIALVESSAHVCARYRIDAFRPYFEAAGHALELVPAPRGVWRWPGLLSRFCRADVVILQRQLLHPAIFPLVRRAAAALMLDFDDAVYQNDSYQREPAAPERMRRFAATVAACDAVVAGNSYLAAEASRWTSPRRVHVIPTCLRPEVYPGATHTRVGAPHLVWVGSSSTLQGLERVRPLLEAVGAALPGARLTLVCDRFLGFQNLRVTEIPWSAAVEADALAGADVGISWLPDDAWSRGKCGLKVLQYMAAGLPVVANPVGVQADMVRHGETGFLATSAGEWCDAVGRLARDPALRRTMGRAGRLLVEHSYNVRVEARRWLGLLDALATSRQAA